MTDQAKERLFFREWRMQAGLSQTELAEILGVTPATVSRIEAGKRDFIGSYLFAFAKACKCPSPGDPVSRPPDQLSFDALMRGSDEERRLAEMTLMAALRPHVHRKDDHN
ncbi:helix-turn-helix domain-containing protein [Sinorhizobium fredii]|uniref:helix-turn-helix domain-containing protein n=1 Tax=Rhizobium fredii TaxID=380 RepID=UPI0004B35CEA|nr:helix-turn-helix transcriptional regulator [Sinorhizobium fredii]